MVAKSQLTMLTAIFASVVARRHAQMAAAIMRVGSWLHASTLLASSLWLHSPNFYSKSEEEVSLQHLLLADA